jgi:hypothetical protein
MTYFQPVILTEAEVRPRITQGDALKVIRDAFMAATRAIFRSYVKNNRTRIRYRVCRGEARKVLGFKAPRFSSWRRRCGCSDASPIP